MSDIVERLRGRRAWQVGTMPTEIMDEAADEIERLSAVRAENVRLHELIQFKLSEGPDRLLTEAAAFLDVMASKLDSFTRWDDEDDRHIETTAAECRAMAARLRGGGGA